MTSPTVSRTAALRDGRQCSDGQFSDGKKRHPPCCTTSAAESSAQGEDPASFRCLPSSFTWPG
jgi:hypothetical protein